MPIINYTDLDIPVQDQLCPNCGGAFLKYVCKEKPYHEEYLICIACHTKYIIDD